MHSCSESEHPVTINCFKTLNFINHGTYGKVYRVEKNCGEDAKEVYAMKALNKGPLSNKQTQPKYIEAEVSSLKALDHPFIIKLKYDIRSGNKAFLALEYVCRKSLFDLLQLIRKPLTEKQASFYLNEVVSAVDYMHSKDIIHRDIKPENIMIDFHGHTKLIDFGLAKLNFFANLRTHERCGTLEYMAPEIFGTNGYGRAVDWWAVGVTFYQALTCRYLFSSSNDEELRRCITKDTKIEIFIPHLSENARDLLAGLLTKNPELRLGSLGKEIKQHSYFKETPWDDVLNGTYLGPPYLPPILQIPSKMVSRVRRIRAAVRSTAVRLLKFN